MAVLAVEAMQITLLCGVALMLGWDAAPGVTPWLSALLLVVAGTAAFSSLGLLMAGTLRAEATLAAANLVYLLLLVSGGIAVPLRDFPAGLRPSLELLPSGAWPRGCATSCATAAACPSGTCSCCWSGPRSARCSPPGPSGGSERLAPTGPGLPEPPTRPLST